MALNFYTAIDLNQNQLIQPRVENLGSDPSGVEGQIYFNTATDKLKVYANGAWANIGDQGTDGVDTLAITAAGTNAGGINTSLVVNSPTGTVTLQPMQYGGGTNIGMVPTGGAVDQYLDGTGTWVSVTTGDVTAVQAATGNALKGIAVASSTGPIPVVGLDIINQTNLGATPAVNDELIIYDLTTTTNKSITVANLMLAAPQGDIESVVGGTGITVDNGSGPNATVNVDYAGADNIVLSATDGTAVTLADGDDFLFNDDSVSTAKYANLSQLKTYINAGTFDDFIISDGTTSQTISTGETITFARPDSSTNGLINLTVSATNTITGNAIIGAAGVATASTLVNRDGSGNIWVTTVNGELTGTINTTTTAATQATTNDTTLVATTAFVQQEISAQTIAFTAAGTTGTNQTITNGNTLTLSNVATTAALGGIETVGVATDTIRFDLDLGGLLPMTSGFNASQDYIIISDNAAHNTRVLPQYIPINDWGAADGTINAGSQLISNVLDPVGLQDAATKNYVDVAVTGLLDFKGGFNASTGIITSGANNGLYLWGVARVAVSVGDLYIAAGSASGNFFGDSDYPLTPGDSVYAVNAVDADTTVVTDFAVAQADTDLATAGASAGAASLGISSYNSANFSVSTGFVSISNVDLGTETTGNYVATAAASAVNNKLGIHISGATGEGQAAIVGLDITGRTALGAVPVADDYLLIYDTSATTNKKVSTANLAGIVQDTNSYAVTVTLAAGVTQTITHGLGTLDVMVQTYDASTYETIIVGVDRTATTTITLTADTLPPNDVRVLIQKIIA